MTLPPLDLHAHIDPSIDEDELYGLGSVVFAVTRSLDEASNALRRSDDLTIWGVGCHPGLVRAHRDFAKDRFDDLLDATSLAGELGLDGKSRVPLGTQIDTLRKAMFVLMRKPRIVSLHSFAATELLINELTNMPGSGRVLHWWLGDATLTKRAVMLGCYFSLPPSAVARRPDLLRTIPLDRVLTETDHPFGDRGARRARPGHVEVVERALALQHNLDAQSVRLKVWQNFQHLVSETGCGQLLPTRIRALLVALRSA